MSHEADEINRNVEELRFRSEINILPTPNKQTDDFEFDFDKHYDKSKGSVVKEIKNKYRIN